MFNKAFILFIFLSSISFAGNGEFWCGEKKFDEYFGPNDPKLINFYRLGNTKFADEVYYDRFIGDKVSPEILSLYSYFKSHIEQGMNCPISDFTQHSPYIKYLIRLASISIHYDFLKKLHLSLYQMGENEESCKIDYEDVFKNCRPESDDMKKFIVRAESYFPQVFDWGMYRVFLHERNYYRIDKYLGPLAGELKSMFPESSMMSTLKTACDYSKKEILKICNEKDSYYGLSKHGHIRKLIETSSAFDVINKKGNGQACVEKFVVVHKRQEEVSYRSFTILDFFKSNLEEIKTEGLYWYGSLRIFDEAGISLIEEPLKEEVKVVVARSKPLPIRPMTKIASVVPKKIRAKKIVKIQKVKVIKKKISAFMTAIEKYKKSKQTSAVDMKIMKGDYRYSRKILKALNGPLRPYQTRVALVDMKKHDKLGTQKKPLSFLFLRYMIDFKLHQGLYNVISILGNEFYVVNDVERKKEAIKILIRNDKETKYKWKLWIVKAPL